MQIKDKYAQNTHMLHLRHTVFQILSQSVRTDLQASPCVKEKIVYIQICICKCVHPIAHPKVVANKRKMSAWLRGNMNIPKNRAGNRA